MLLLIPTDGGGFLWQCPELKREMDAIYEHWKSIQDKDVVRVKPIRTQSELDEEHLAEIVDGIVRYSKQKMAVPTEWIEEYNSIIERERNKTNSK